MEATLLVLVRELGRVILEGVNAILRLRVILLSKTTWPATFDTYLKTRKLTELRTYAHTHPKPQENRGVIARPRETTLALATISGEVREYWIAA